MKRTSFTIGIVVGIAAVGAAAVAVAGDRPGSNPELRVVSNVGEPFDVAAVPAESRRILDVTGATGSPRFVARRGRLAFYTAEKADGSRCYMTGATAGAGPAFGSVSCLAVQPGGFPSETSPILDASGFSYDTRTGESSLTALAGFAADGVAGVGIVDSAGRTHLARVTRNVYASTDAAGSTATAIVAVDRDGREVYRMPLIGS